jgi:hypothetical protein
MNATINTSNEEVFAALKDAATSPYVQVAYRLDKGGIKVVDMGYTTGNQHSKKELKQQFRFGCMRVNDNLLTGHEGYVRDADGTIYRICRENKTAEKVFWMQKV